MPGLGELENLCYDVMCVEANLDAVTQLVLVY